MILRVTPQARRHLNDIALTERSPRAAKRVRVSIQRAFTLLTHFPLRGRDGVLPGTREIIVRSLPYIAEDTVVVLGIYHGAQLRPGQDEPSDL